jgi:putative NIF3 family GTP cyclohydrolase 1 type 2
MPVTQSTLIRFISSFLPPRPDDVPLYYHVPNDGYHPFETTPVSQVVLSVTPTKNVYDLISNSNSSNSKSLQISLLRADSQDANERALPDGQAQPGTTIAFFHRPFTLDLPRLRNANVLVLASHTSFDENLTVGWNPALAARLGVDVTPSPSFSSSENINDNTVCVIGYKGDPTRRIGTVARVSTILGPLLQSIEREFGSIEHAQEGLSEEIYVLAMMNAFSADDVDRVLDMASERNWVPCVEQLGRHVLYLTGQPRKSGLEAAKKRGMTVVCVGKRVAEQWGISYLGARIRAEFPGLKVSEVYEDELRG